MSKADNFLGGLSAETFLRDYWQKKPLLVRNAFPDIAGLISPDVLAGLALEPGDENDAEYYSEDELEGSYTESGVESRLIRSHINQQGQTQWQLTHGPFSEEQLKSLPDKDWTLLVQAVDMYYDGVAELLDLFSFIPRWRMDDIMISLAAPGGSVGPHYDNYDVFLIQGMGKRHWQIGEACSPQSALIQHPELRILADMATVQEWTLKPGDMLYLPPRIAHHGVAIDNCMTYSVGFRAPTLEDFFDKITHQINTSTQANKRYQDPDLAIQKNTGWLSPHAVNKVQQMMMEALQDKDQIQDCLAKLVSEPKYPLNYEELSNEESQDQPSTKEFLALLKQNTLICRDGYSRFVYTGYTGQADQVEKFYINGSEIPLPNENLELARELVIQLCNKRYHSAESLGVYLNHTSLCKWFLSLYHKGYFYIQQQASKHHEP